MPPVAQNNKNKVKTSENCLNDTEQWQKRIKSSRTNTYLDQEPKFILPAPPNNCTTSTVISLNNSLI